VRRALQKGFTLIEVSLAIVIGVIILAGGINLYNQTKVNAGNSKAQEKTQALAALVEELAAVSNNGEYPKLDTVASQWSSRREDYLTSPWGGPLAANQWVVNFGAPPANTGPMSWGTVVSAKYTTQVASAGQLMYIRSSGATTSCYDNNSGIEKTYTGYMCAIINQAGDGPNFVIGGR